MTRLKMSIKYFIDYLNLYIYYYSKIDYNYMYNMCCDIKYLYTLSVFIIIGFIVKITRGEGIPSLLNFFILIAELGIFRFYNVIYFVLIFCKRLLDLQT